MKASHSLRRFLAGSTVVLVLAATPAHGTVTFFNGYSSTPTEVNSTTSLT